MFEELLEEIAHTFRCPKEFLLNLLGELFVFVNPPV
jgi:hypothetical protein